MPPAKRGIMFTNLRAAVVFLSCCVLGNGASAASDIDAAINSPDDAYRSPLPGAAASFPLTAKSAVLPASADMPLSNAAAGAAADRDSNGCCDECSSCEDCCPPLWNISAGAVILHRDRPSDGTIIGAQPSGSPAFSRGSDFDFGWDGGPEITIARTIGRDNSLEARYFNCYGSADTQFVAPSSFIGAGFVGPRGTAISGHDLTKLDSIEINWRHQAWDRLVLMAGFRTIELRDYLSYKIGSPALADYDYGNHLYGGQIGADWALAKPSSPLQLGVALKAGVYGNADHGGVALTLGGGPAGNFGGQDTTTAFVGELDFLAAYNLTNHIAVHGGYQLLWLTNLVLATDAANRSLLNPSLLRTVSDDGRLFYQGATVGIDFMW